MYMEKCKVLVRWWQKQYDMIPKCTLYSMDYWAGSLSQQMCFRISCNIRNTKVTVKQATKRRLDYTIILYHFG